MISKLQTQNFQFSFTSNNNQQQPYVIFLIVFHLRLRSRFSVCKHEPSVQPTGGECCPVCSSFQLHPWNVLSLPGTTASDCVFVFSVADMTAVVTSLSCGKIMSLKMPHPRHLPAWPGRWLGKFPSQTSGPRLYLPGIPWAQGRLRPQTWDPPFLW